MVRIARFAFDDSDRENPERRLEDPVDVDLDWNDTLPHAPEQAPQPRRRRRKASRADGNETFDSGRPARERGGDRR